MTFRARPISDYVSSSRTSQVWLSNIGAPLGRTIVGSISTTNTVIDDESQDFDAWLHPLRICWLRVKFNGCSIESPGEVLRIVVFALLDYNRRLCQPEIGLLTKYICKCDPLRKSWSLASGLSTIRLWSDSIVRPRRGFISAKILDWLVGSLLQMLDKQHPWSSAACVCLLHSAAATFWGSLDIRIFDSQVGSSPASWDWVCGVVWLWQECLAALKRRPSPFYLKDVVGFKSAASQFQYRITFSLLSPGSSISSIMHSVYLLGLMSRNRSIRGFFARHPADKAIISVCT